VLTQGPERAAGDGRDHVSFNSQFVAQYHLMSAGSIVAAIPPVAYVLPDAAPLHRRPDPRSRQMTKLAFIGAGSTVFMKNIVGDALLHCPRWPTPSRADGHRPGPP
jgi:hypothetical protein